MKTTLVILTTLLLSACANLDKVLTGGDTPPTPQEREQRVMQFSDLTVDQKKKFVEGTPWIGMSGAHLSAMWNASPKKTQKKITARGNEEIQLYHLRIGSPSTGIVSKYWRVIMVDGKTAELQELDPNAGSLDKI